MNFLFLFFALCLFHLAPGLSAQTSTPSATNAPTPTAPAMKVTSETAPIIEATRETLTKWVETKQLISKEKSEWASGKDILEDRVRLAEAETTTVRDKLKEISAAVAEAQKKRDELAAQTDKLKATAEKSKAMVIAAEKKLRPLLPQLPEPLREKLKPIIARFPEDSEKWY